MRCSTCGTENEADSRFCGGCGARIGQQAEPRLAPTHKITDDAPYPQQAAPPVAAANAPVSYAPPSMPPTSRLGTPVPSSDVRPASQPPRPAAPPQVSTASASFTVPPSRPIGLMVALLIVDIGLAAAGAVLLSKGLASDEATADAKAEPAPADHKTEAPASAAATQITAAPAASVEPVAAAVTTAAAPTPPPPAPTKASPAPASASPAARKMPVEPKAAAKPAEAKPAAKPADTKPAAKPADTKPATKPADTKPAAKPADTKPAAKATGPVTSPTETEAKRGASASSGPQDPYAAEPAAIDTAREIDAAAARSKASFDRCASEHGPVQGSIEVAFQVRPDGRIANAAAVTNSTGNSELARCLVAEIASWRVSAHGGAAINMSRPFTYR